MAPDVGGKLYLERVQIRSDRRQPSAVHGSEKLLPFLFPYVGRRQVDTTHRSIVLRGTEPIRASSDGILGLGE